MSRPSLLDAVLASLDGDAADASLEAALQVLRAQLLAASSGAGQPWLELQRGARKLSLFAEPGATLPDSHERQLISQALGVALARLAEHDEMRRARERMQLLSEASFEAIMFHRDGVVVDYNQRALELFGYAPGETLEPNAMHLRVSPDDLAEAEARIRNRVEGAFLLTIVRKDGTRFRAEFCTRQCQIGDRPVRVVALRDVSERERTAALLRESEQRLQQLLDSTFDCVVLSRDGTIVEVGRGVDTLFGLARAQMIGRPVLEFAAPDVRQELQRRIQDAVTGTFETLVIGRDGEIIPVEIVSTMTTLDGEPVRAAGLRDLRAARRLEQERRRLELQVERSQRLESLGVLAGGIAHDFNNLLVGVVGSAELLADSVSKSEDRALAETIRIAGERAAGLTKQMLAYAGRRELTAPEPIDLSALLSELRGLLDAALSKKAQLTFELAPKSIVKGERATLMQVMMNLLTNASDALDNRPGTIHVSTSHVETPDARWDDALGATVGPGDWVLVQVRDTGVGMDSPTQRRIFEPFFSTKPHGHGLGLGSCLGIVAAHGGAILVESEPHKGSTFSVLLPASRSATPAATRPRSTSARPCRVLVIDDEPLVRAHLRRLLELRGFAVEEALNAHTGLESIARTQPDLAVLDLSMPDMDGVEVVRRLRAAGVQVPVVLCSGNLDYARERGLEPGMVQAVLQKPFSADELIQAIELARS